MKLTIKQLLVLVGLLISTLSYGQVPQKFNYQGIARDVKGNPLANQKMSLKLSVLPTQDATVAEYEETQLVTTNEFGLYTLQIGNGQVVTGDMKTVKWETGNKYINVSIDPTGGSNYVDAGTTQLLSVPYALYSDRSGSAKESAPSTRATNNYIEKTNGSGVANSTSQLYDNGTNIGYGTTTPSAKFHISNTVSAVQEHLRMQNLSGAGAGRFTMYNDGASSYATFTKYGTTYAGGYAGVAALYPYANLLAFGNNGLAAGDGNGRFLISSGGNVGLSLFKSGSSKLKFHADFTTENVGIGGSAAPIARIHANNTDGTTMDLRLTNNTTGHLVGDGLEIRNVGSLANITNKENNALTFGTNAAERMRVDATGNVGIGTISPTAKLEVAGQVKISGGTPGAGKVLTSDATGLATWQTPVSGGSSQWTTTGTDISNNNTGNVGIGNTNVNNTAYGHGGTNKILEINNSGTLWDEQAQLVLSTDAAYGGSIGGITWVNKNTGALDQRAAFIGTVFDDFNQDATDINFWTRKSSGYLTQKMSIGNEGRVRIEGPDASAAGLNSLSIGGFGAVGVDAPGVPNGRFVVTEGGNVGIGNDAPNAKLDVNGGAIMAPGSSQVIIGDDPSPSALWKMKLIPTNLQGGLAILGPANQDGNNFFSNYESDYENAVFRNTKSTGKSSSVHAINFSSNDSASCLSAYAPDGATGLKIETYNGTNGGVGINVRSNNKQAIIASSAESQTAYFVASPTGSNPNLSNGAVEVNINANLNADYPAIVGRNTLNTSGWGIGVEGRGGYIGIRGKAENTGIGNRYGIFGYATGGNNFNYGVYGSAAGTNAFAGYFSGNVHINGTLSKSGGTFKIDHPQDPANKYLIHSFVESPDMMNVYNGNISTDANGYATVKLPSYFEAENKDFKYQLTVIGTFAQAIVKEKVSNNQFKIQTNQPNIEVSWQVTGVRQDAWANANRVIAEVEKNEQEKGKYLHPGLHGQPASKSMNYEEKAETNK